MLSLGGIRYRSVLVRDGGPIESLEEGQIDVLAVRYAQANARLKHGLRPRQTNQMYSDADGTGMDPSPTVARHIAVSEALERWAYSETVYSKFRVAHGFDVDPSSNGMAAFPGLTSNPAKRLARLEALERSLILHWWKKRLDGKLLRTKWRGIFAVTLNISPKPVAVILFTESHPGVFSYGHAAGNSFSHACDRAILELIRHEWTIKSWLKKYNNELPRDIFEQRSLYFSTKEGHSIFMNRLKEKAEVSALKLDLLCDSEIVGPWTRYATIWRALYQPPSLDFINADQQYFYW